MPLHQFLPTPRNGQERFVLAHAHRVGRLADIEGGTPVFTRQLIRNQASISRTEFSASRSVSNCRTVWGGPIEVTNHSADSPAVWMVWLGFVSGPVAITTRP